MGHSRPQISDLTAKKKSTKSDLFALISSKECELMRIRLIPHDAI